MDRHVAVVTDSTSYLPTQWAVDAQIIKVPVGVIVSGQAFREGVDISTAGVARALRDWMPVSTSRPSPVDFMNAYQQAAASGVEHIVSAHLSAELSGDVPDSVACSEESPVPVTVIDSRTLAMGLGLRV